jgi:hypothetical protein
MHDTGTKEIKYPIRKSQGSRADFMQPETKTRIIRGRARMTSIIGLIMRCL